MAFIYKITNKINNKVYIGKTCSNIDTRWKEHIRTAKRFPERPLYRAFNKYGIDNFFIEQIEECSSEIVNNREIYWIEYYDSYHFGYNATQGGEGTLKYNIPKEVIEECLANKMTQKEMSELFECDGDVIKRLIDDYGLRNQETYAQKQRKEVMTTTYDGKEWVFPSQAAAARWLIDNNLSSATANSLAINIGRCCKGERHSCCGLQWKYKE